MVPFAYFGINSSALSLVVDLLILFLAIIYVALIYWTFNDARRRIADPLLVGCAFVIAFFPFVGPLVYTILRPPETLEDAAERELDVRAAEARLAQLDYGLCPHCDYRVERDFVRCPSCLRKLKERCSGCARPLDPAWAICPYCETEVPAAKPTRERRRSARGERNRAHDRTREREERNGQVEQDTTVATDVTLVDEALVDAESLLEKPLPTDEQLVRPADEGPAPASESGAAARSEARRARRTRPTS
ncbi:MAG TPA: zinc ribbon domain-containing protein [Solirubrobacteraceae bacterium]|jgi:hypothetical protein